MTCYIIILQGALPNLAITLSAPSITTIRSWMESSGLTLKCAMSNIHTVHQLFLPQRQLQQLLPGHISLQQMRLFMCAKLFQMQKEQQTKNSEWIANLPIETGALWLISSQQSPPEDNSLLKERKYVTYGLPYQDKPKRSPPKGLLKEQGNYHWAYRVSYGFG